MITRKGIRQNGIWYDLQMGYYSFWDCRHSHQGFFADINFMISGDEEREYCVLIPETPYYDNKVFNKGTLRISNNHFSKLLRRLKNELHKIKNRIASYF